MIMAFMTRNITDMVGLIGYANDLSGSILTPLFCMAIWVICFTIMLGEGVDRAFIFASFVSFVVSVLFIAMGIISTSYIVIFLVLLAFSAFLAWRK